MGTPVAPAAGSTLREQILERLRAAVTAYTHRTVMAGGSPTLDDFIKKHPEYKRPELHGHIAVQMDITQRSVEFEAEKRTGTN